MEEEWREGGTGLRFICSLSRFPQSEEGKGLEARGLAGRPVPSGQSEALGSEGWHHTAFGDCLCFHFLLWLLFTGDFTALLYPSFSLKLVVTDARPARGESSTVTGIGDGSSQPGAQGICEAFSRLSP